MSFVSPSLAPILLLIGSNVFMTFAWYGHLKYTERPLMVVILVSWSIALFEYCLAVPANRIGYAIYSTAEMKVLQKVITLCVFAGFSVLYLGERLTLNHLVGFTLICAGAFFVFKGLCCTNRVRDSSRESSVVAGVHEHTYTFDLQEIEQPHVWNFSEGVITHPGIPI